MTGWGDARECTNRGRKSEDDKMLCVWNVHWCARPSGGRRFKDRNSQAVRAATVQHVFFPCREQLINLVSRLVGNTSGDDTSCAVVTQPPSKDYR